MQLDVGIAFFILGAVATLLGTKIQFPKGLYQALILFLMLAIGLKGGVALAEHASWSLLGQSVYASVCKRNMQYKAPAQYTRLFHKC